MSRIVELVTIFLASPSGLARERRTVRAVAQELNGIWLKDTGIYLDVVGWEETPSGIAGDPQEVVNRYIGEDYDIFLGLMGVTLGSPTPRADSGTVEEYGRALARYREDPDAVDIMFYFRQAGRAPNLTSSQAASAVAAFRAQISTDGVYYKDFLNSRGLESLLRQDLGRKIQQWKYRRPVAGAKGDAKQYS